VIFVDLSLAQVAAFGATLAILLGFDHHSSATYFVSLASTFLAAALFALARRHEDLFSQGLLSGLFMLLHRHPSCLSSTESRMAQNTSKIFW